jgi:hypothetical protein
VFNVGVQGDTGRLALPVSRFPREVNLTPDQLANIDALPLVSDLRRITYWLAGGNSDSPFGLARQELKVVTTDDLDSIPPDNIPDETVFVIAEEVKSLTFSYFDGTNWNDTWDGTSTDQNGNGPIGPPVAIAITIGIYAPGVAGADPDTKLKYYRHVVAIQTANGTSQTISGSNQQ